MARVDAAPDLRRAGLAEEFPKLVARWKSDTAHLSTMWQMVLHPAYQSIIGMGPDVLHLLFAELKADPDHWFWALQHITRADPVPASDKGDLDGETKRWLVWAKEHGYLD